MAAALAAIDTAIAADEQRRAARPGPESDDEPDQTPAAGRSTGAGDAADRLPLKRRWWPMRELIRASLAMGEPIVWGA